MVIRMVERLFQLFYQLLIAQKKEEPKNHPSVSKDKETLENHKDFIAWKNLKEKWNWRVLITQISFNISKFPSRPVLHIVKKKALSVVTWLRFKITWIIWLYSLLIKNLVLHWTKTLSRILLWKKRSATDHTSN